MRSYKRYTRRKRLLKQIAVVALVFILGFVLLRAVSYMAIQGEIPMINSFNLFRREADTVYQAKETFEANRCGCFIS